MRAMILQQWQPGYRGTGKRSRATPFKIRVAPEVEACMPVDSEPKPVLPSHIMTAGGFTPSPPVEVEVNGRMFQLVTDSSVACGSEGFTNCEYILRDDDIVMFTPEAPEQIEALFDDLTALWHEKKLQEGINQTDSMHLHVSLYDEANRPITTTTHPFLEFFIQTIYIRDHTLEYWAKELGPNIRRTQSPLPKRIAPFDDFYPRYDLNVKPIGDERYTNVNGNQRHVHIEFRSMSSFHKLNKEQFVKYMELIYEFMRQALEISTDITQWKNVLGSDRVIDVYGSGIRDEALPTLRLAEAAGYTVNIVEPDD